MEWKTKKIINGKKEEVVFRSVTGREKQELMRGEKDDFMQINKFLAMSITKIPLTGPEDKTWDKLNIGERVDVLLDLDEAEIDALANEYGERRKRIVDIKKA